MKRKERLYVSALNRSRPLKYPKVRKLPTIGNLPTIFESLPYPVTLEALMNPIEEEEAVNEAEEIINEVRPVCISSKPRKSKKKFRKIKSFFKKISCIQGIKD